MALLALACMGCDPIFDTEVMPPSVEVIHADANAQVVVRIGEASGFPDPVGEYQIDVEPTSGAPVTILEGRAQVTSVRHQAKATRLPSGEIAVALRETLCVMRAGRPLCTDLLLTTAPSELASALRWRADDTRLDLRVRAHAAFSLASYDAPAAITILETLDGRPYAGSASIGPHIRGVLARLRRDTPEVEALRNELPEARGSFLIGVARACIPELQAPIRAELMSRPESLRSVALAALAACPAR